MSDGEDWTSLDQQRTASVYTFECSAEIDFPPRYPSPSELPEGPYYQYPELDTLTPPAFSHANAESQLNEQQSPQTAKQHEQWQKEASSGRSERPRSSCTDCTQLTMSKIRIWPDVPTYRYSIQIALGGGEEVSEQSFENITALYSRLTDICGTDFMPESSVRRVVRMMKGGGQSDWTRGSAGEWHATVTASDGQTRVFDRNSVQGRPLQ